jgi:hypothetical protein
MFPLCSLHSWEARAVSDKPIQGERMPGGFILITGIDGPR